MRSEKGRCESCSMPVESGPYCPYCVDEHGNLQTFEVRLDRMIQWMRGRTPGLSAAEAEANALSAMATMPAWRDHPRVRARAAGRTRRA